jgi:hypothetical protein
MPYIRFPCHKIVNYVCGVPVYLLIFLSRLYDTIGGSSGQKLKHSYVKEDIQMTWWKND